MTSRQSPEAESPLGSQPEAPPSPAESSRAAKRARILEAAIRVCERRGVEGARMEEVAALARVSKGTLYHFFESKQDLFLASLIDSYEQSLRLVDAALAAADADPRARLARVRDGLCQVLAANAARVSVHYQAWGVVAGDPAFEERLHGFLRDFFRARSEEIEAVIREGQRRGAFCAEASAAVVTEGVLALLSGFLYRAAFDADYGDPARLRGSFDALVWPALGAVPSGTGGDGSPGADRGAPRG